MAAEELTLEQASVVVRIREQLEAYAQERTGVSHEPERPSQALLTTTDRASDHRVHFIDGARGAGKTTILYSVLSAYARVPGTIDGCVPRRDDACSLVPLRVVDLFALGDTSEVLHVMVGGLRRLAEELKERAPRRDWERDELDERWADVERSIAGRRGHGASLGNLDSDAYARELSDDAHADLHLEFALERFVHALAERWRGLLGMNHPPIFLVSIDDADMSPNRVTELLQLIALFRHPHVVFLLTGDRELFVTSLESAFEAQFGRRGGGPARHRTSVARRATRLAERRFAKYLPAAQRYDVPRLPSARREKWSPTSRLTEHLGEWRLNAAVSFADVMCGGNSEANPRLPFLSHSRLDALPDLLRDLQDLEVQITRLAPPTSSDARNFASLDQPEHALGRRLLELAARRSQFVEIDDLVEAVFSRQDVQRSKVARGLETRLESRGRLVAAGVRVETHAATQLRFGRCRRVTTDVLAALALVNDVHAHGSQGESSLFPTSLLPRLSRVSGLYVQAPGELDGYDLGWSEPPRLRWPTPPWTLVALHESLSRTVEAWTSFDSADALCLAYLGAIHESEGAQSHFDSLEQLLLRDKELTTPLLDLGLRFRSNDDPWWGLFAFPEYGLSQAAREQVVDALQQRVTPGAERTRVYDDLEQQRVEALAAAGLVIDLDHPGLRATNPFVRTSLRGESSSSLLRSSEQVSAPGVFEESQPYTWQRLLMSPTRQALWDNAHQELETQYRATGSLSRTARLLWQRVGRFKPLAESSVVPLEGELELPELHVMWAPGERVYVRPERGSFVKRVDVHTPTVTTGYAEDAALDLLSRVLSDVEAIESADQFAEVHDEPELGTSTMVLDAGDDPIVLPWPSVRTTRLWDAELIAAAWARALDLATRGDRALHSEFENLVDRYAYAYARAVFRGLAGHIEPTSPTEQLAPEAAWRFALTPRPPMDVADLRPRDVNIRGFLESLPLFAAPEFGLTQNTRTALLTVIFDEESAPSHWRDSSTDERRIRLRSARIGHLISHSSRSREEAQALLDRIDAQAGKDDPWFTWVGPDDRASSPKTPASSRKVRSSAATKRTASSKQRPPSPKKRPARKRS